MAWLSYKEIVPKLLFNNPLLMIHHVRRIKIYINSKEFSVFGCPSLSLFLVIRDKMVVWKQRAGIWILFLIPIFHHLKCTSDSWKPGSEIQCQFPIMYTLLFPSRRLVIRFTVHFFYSVFVLSISCSVLFVVEFW